MKLSFLCSSAPRTGETRVMGLLQNRRIFRLWIFHICVAKRIGIEAGNSEFSVLRRDETRVKNTVTSQDIDTDEKKIPLVEISYLQVAEQIEVEAGNSESSALRRDEIGVKKPKIAIRHLVDEKKKLRLQKFHIRRLLS